MYSAKNYNVIYLCLNKLYLGKRNRSPFLLMLSCTAFIRKKKKQETHIIEAYF